MPSLQTFHHPAGLLHDTGPGHPERIARLEAVLHAITALGLSTHNPQDSGPAPDSDTVTDAIAALHSPHYIARLHDACAAGRPFIDCRDSAICPRSLDAARAAVACGLAAADFIMSKTHHRAFVAMRPPGHHAERDRSMGFCLFNTIALTAQYLIDAHRLSRLAILDFDVHHGNGTQHLFENRADILFISTHQDPATLYPGTGYAWETGTRGSPGAGFTLNLPLPPGSGHEEALAAINDKALPRLREYQPEAILISAGFDADRRDPLAGLNWTPQTYAEITSAVTSLADECCSGRVLSVLEGGYDLDALREGVTGHLRALS